MRLAVIAACLLTPAFAAAAPPEPPREFRGVWVASVANIDWPSKPGLPADEQKKELVALLDRFAALHFNAVVLQVRPMADSLYESKLEPWSEFLTGTSGKSPGYDPLAFAVTEAHKRGLELHAWFNPYRARSPKSKGTLDPSHLVSRRPDLAKTYGKHSWLNPTSREVQDHSLAVIADVVKRYDIDGVHLDDYFYPYPELDAAKAEIPFPDDDTWAAYTAAGGKLARDDWRRDAVNTFVKRMYAETHAAKPWVKVGISPFGIWKPGHPEGISGFNQHGKLYADAKLWLNEGWVDYWTPQLYWPIAQEAQSYPKLLAWWAGENTKKRHLWPGNIPSRVGAAKPWPASEIAEQIKLTRKVAGGNVHFSAKPILANVAGIADEFAKVYATPALVPASPWLGDTKPAVPECGDVGATDPPTFCFAAPANCVGVVQTRVGDTWATKCLGDGARMWRETPNATETWVRSLSRSGILSDAVQLK